VALAGAAERVGRGFQAAGRFVEVGGAGELLGGLLEVVLAEQAEEARVGDGSGGLGDEGVRFRGAGAVARAWQRSVTAEVGGRRVGALSALASIRT